MYLAGTLFAVDTGDTYFNEISKEAISGSVDSKIKLQRERIKKKDLYTGLDLEARIEYARFIVDCPNCNNAEFAFEDGLFLCTTCKNSYIGNKVRKVKMPDKRKQIENVLSKRLIQNRHWTSKETMEDLENENIAHGLEVI